MSKPRQLPLDKAYDGILRSIRKAAGGGRTRWIQTGGGCWIGRDKKYPCDDTFESKRTGRSIEVFSTLGVHQSLPQKLRSLSDLRKLKRYGLKLPTNLRKSKRYL